MTKRDTKLERLKAVEKLATRRGVGYLFNVPMSCLARADDPASSALLASPQTDYCICRRLIDDPARFRRVFRSLDSEQFGWLINDVLEMIDDECEQPQPSRRWFSSSLRNVPSLWPEMSQVELVAWAKSRQMKSQLSLKAASLFTSFCGDPPPQCRTLTVADFITAKTMPAGHYRRNTVPLELQLAAIHFLDDLAGRLKFQRERTRRFLSQVHKPADPRLSDVFDQLAGSRKRLLRTILPADLATNDLSDISLVLDPLKLTTEKGSDGSFGPSDTAFIDFDSDDSGVSVGCRASRLHDGNGCALQLQLIEHAMQMLSDGSKKPDPMAIRLRAELTRPQWARRLGSLGRRIERAEHPHRQFWDDGGQFAWRIDGDQDDGIIVRPILVRPFKSKPGFRGKQLDKADLHDLVHWRASKLDQEILHSLGISSVRWGGGGSFQPDSERTFDLLSRHRRVFTLEAKKLKRAWVTPHRLTLSVELTDGDTVRLCLRAFDREIELGRVRDAVNHQNFIVERSQNGEVFRYLALSRKLAPVLSWLHDWGANLPREAIPQLVTLLPTVSELIDVDLDRSLRLRERPAMTRAVFRLEMLRGERLNIELRIEPDDGGPLVIPNVGAPVVYQAKDGGVVRYRRDLPKEQLVADELVHAVGLGHEGISNRYEWQISDLDAALALVERLSTLENATVKWAQSRKPKVSRGAGYDDLVISLKGQRDYFGLSGTLSVDGLDVPLEQLLWNIRRKKRFIKVKDGAFVQISEELSNQLGRLASATDDELETPISPFAGSLFEELSDAGIVVDAPLNWHEFRGKIEAAEELQFDVPAGLNADLRPYQLDGYRWLRKLSHWSSGACLADDMGLGKTVQALALLLDRAKLGPALVVAPTSVGFNWARETERFAPSLNVISFRGKGKTDVLTKLGPGDLVITSYDLIHRYQDTWNQTNFATLVLDEAQAIKNRTTRRAQAIYALQREFCLALTGTPLENRTGDLWSLFRATVPGLLGSVEHFVDRFALPIERDDNDDARKALSSLIMPFILRRLKSEVAKDLPARTEIRLDVRLGDQQFELYDGFRKAAIEELKEAAQSNGKSMFKAFAAMTRLRQIACHPQLVYADSTAPSAKLEVLAELMTTLKAEGHRALIFSQFTEFLAKVRELLDSMGLRYCYLDGSTPVQARQKQVDIFQQGQHDAFVISLRAGGTGLNLTEADYVIHLDPWWNPAVEDQATDRAHRIGQDKPVTVYRLVARGTIEDAILTLQADKRDLVDGLLAGTSQSNKLSPAELLNLLDFGLL